MKKVFGILAIGLVAMSFMASSDKSTKQDDQGLKFKSISLADAKKQALKNEKYIFIDAHTSWCGPCKKMAATSFKNAEVGAVFNEKFINLKIDVEQDADGPELAKMYKVRAYPTLLIIDGEGKLIKQVVGFQTEDRLLALASSVDN
ncbi:MAG: thioredoxin family protein [Flavobacteriia bacterium]